MTLSPHDKAREDTMRERLARIICLADDSKTCEAKCIHPWGPHDGPCPYLTNADAIMAAGFRLQPDLVKYAVKLDEWNDDLQAKLDACEVAMRAAINAGDHEHARAVLRAALTALDGGAERMSPEPRGEP